MFAHANKLFVAIIILATLTYFERPDYNLPLFAFALLLWNHKDPQQKTRMWYLMSFSILTDVIWLTFWAITWGSYENKQRGICSFTLIVSLIELIVKLITVGILYVNEPDCKSAITELPSNIKSIFETPQAYSQV